MTAATPRRPAGMALSVEAFTHSRDQAGLLPVQSRGRVHSAPCRFRLTLLGALLLMAWFAVTLGVMGLALPAAAGEPAAGDMSLAPQGPVDFEECVRIAVRQSPHLIKSDVEIDIRRLDEADSRYGMIPPLTFRSYYYVTHPQRINSDKPYSLNFSTDPYNPIGAYLTLQAQKLATQIAVLGHLKVIAEGLHRLGRLFLELATLKRLAGYQSQLVSLARENLTYAENRLSIGTGTSLEVRLAAQELELARNEQERLSAQQRRNLSALRAFLGLKTGHDLTLDLRDAPRQVLGNFDAAAATLEGAKSRSHELKALEIKKQLQEYHVLLAKAKVLPSILFTTQTPDPLSIATDRGLYVGFGLEVPIWDGFKRIRNVSRQKAVLKQVASEKGMKELDLEEKWQTARDEVLSAAAGRKMALSHEELARLKERQSDIRYQSGGEPLPVMIEGRKGSLEAQKNVAVKSLDYDAAVLTLRLISGELGNSYVDAHAWQK